MKSKFKGKSNRTSGWQTQVGFDNLLSDLDVSSLKFLNKKYIREIRDFHNLFDLNDEENQQFYKEMLQRKNMIKDEMTNRMMDIYASQSYQDRGDYFDVDTSLVIDKNSNILYSVAYNEDYSNIIYDSPSNISTFVTENSDNEEDYSFYTPTDEKELRIKIYSEWKYSNNDE